MTGVELWWLGQAGFRLRDVAGSATVFVDPFLTPGDERAWQAPVEPHDLAQADLIVVSHEHTDHLDRPALRQAARTPDARFTLVVPWPIADEVASDLGLPSGRVIGAHPDAPIDLAGVHIQPVPARHGVNVSDAYTFGQELPHSHGRVRYLGYVIELGGVRVYHAGDCSPYLGQADRLKALRPHVALLPINGRDFFRELDHNIVGNMDAREAARLASDMGVELLIPMHWELFATNRGYPAHLVSYVADTFPTLSTLILGRGQRFIFTPSQP